MLYISSSADRLRVRWVPSAGSSFTETCAANKAASRRYRFALPGRRFECGTDRAALQNRTAERSPADENLDRRERFTHRSGIGQTCTVVDDAHARAFWPAFRRPRTRRRRHGIHDGSTWCFAGFYEEKALRVADQPSTGAGTCPARGHAHCRLTLRWSGVRSLHGRGALQGTLLHDLVGVLGSRTAAAAVAAAGRAVPTTIARSTASRQPAVSRSSTVVARRAASFEWGCSTNRSAAARLRVWPCVPLPRCDGRVPGELSPPLGNETARRAATIYTSYTSVTHESGRPKRQRRTGSPCRAPHSGRGRVGRCDRSAGATQPQRTGAAIRA